MTIKDLVRPVPGVRQASIYRQRFRFRGSADYWEQNYALGRTSGSGSYGMLADGKALVLNEFVAEHGIESVIEFGCGDGNQLALARYPRYVGLDVSRHAVALCQERFAADDTKSFFLYDGQCFTDRAQIFTADLALSLDVIYHLVEDEVFETYMRHLFGAGRRFVIAYTTNEPADGTAPHVRHRNFTSWVHANLAGWHLQRIVQGPSTEPGRADFFVYSRTDDAEDPRTPLTECYGPRP